MICYNQMKTITFDQNRKKKNENNSLNWTLLESLKTRYVTCQMEKTSN